MRKRVYIAGPITKGSLLDNIQQADLAFHDLVQAGFAPLNPMWSVYAGGARTFNWLEPDRVHAFAERNSALNLPHQAWIEIDLPWVSVADAVLRLPGESVGADRETAHAKALGIPVFTSLEMLLRCFSSQSQTI